MMRRFHGGDSNALDTINAAASAIASAENRLPRPTAQKRRWTSFWCFGFQRHRKRIGHAVLAPENSASGNDSSAAEHPTQPPPPITLPFVAPPSSPASFLQSDPPSALQSPAGVMSLTSISASMYSPSGPASIFAIGPYAHETQLVSPPVFSTFTTEPSTAPFTPPPESVHLTTPSSPEVPFAQLLDPSLRNSGTGLQFPFSNYEFHSYHLYPGSPVGQLISPSSGVSGSGTSSPFPDGEFAATGPRFPEFHIPDAPRLFNLGNEWESGQGLGTFTPDSARPTSSNLPVDYQFSDVASRSNSFNGKYDDQVPSHRVSFELTAEEALSCAGSNPSSPVTVIPDAASRKTTTTEPNSSKTEQQNFDWRVDETSNETPEKAPTEEKYTPRHQKHRSLTLSSLKEFNFDSTNGGGDPQKPNHNGLDWWSNGTDIGKEDGACKNWSFPVMQPDTDQHSSGSFPLATN